ncbi:sodium:calcium antiporter [Candidatus Woesearchaeota archaeon]|nr:sodium:calcium antiporter [Candidatus Woesearchaeota archaeon]
MIPTFIFFIVSCAALIIAGSLLVRSLSHLASFLRVSEYTLSFILMAFSTSLPELMVGVMSGIYASNSLALGTVIGSNIADVTLVIGIVVLLNRGLRTRKAFIRRDTRWMVVFSVLPMALMVAGHELSRVDGLLLLFAYGFYLRHLLSGYVSSKQRLHNRVSKLQSILSTLMFLVSLFLLFKSADYVVFYGAELAQELALPPILIGLFFVAIGTSLPELVFETMAAQQGHKAMALGDVIGSVVANSTLVLGISAIINPITANYNLFLVSAVFMIVAVFLFATFLESGWGFTVHEGIAMILLYILFVVIELTMKRVIMAGG